MTNIRYAATRNPKWLAMVRRGNVLVVEAGLAGERLSDLWSSLADATGQKAVLDALTRGGISSTPEFAFVATAEQFGSTPGPVTLIVRGSLEVSVDTASDPVIALGADVSTWIERDIADAVALRIGPKQSASDGAADFILNDGTAPISWIRIGEPRDAVPVPVPAAVAVASVAAVAPAPKVAPTRATVLTPPPVPVDPGMTISDPTMTISGAEPEAEGGSDYDFLFGETVMRTVEDAAVRESEPAHAEAAGDHDGRTAIGLSAAERRAARQARQKGSVAPVAAVQQFHLQFSTGERETLDQTLIVGRAPSATKVSSSSVPRLMTVGGPDQDISRNHVQVSVEGGTVLVTDLHSRNGTIVTLPGRAPQQLRGGQPTAVIHGANVDLGSGISFVVEEN